MLISNNVGVMNNAESIRTWKQTPVEISFTSRLVEKNYAPVVESVENGNVRFCSRVRDSTAQIIIK